jgi:DNA primase
MAALITAVQMNTVEFHTERGGVEGINCPTAPCSDTFDLDRR